MHDEYIKKRIRFKFTFSNICAAIMFFCQHVVFLLAGGNFSGLVLSYLLYVPPNDDKWILFSLSVTT